MKGMIEKSGMDVIYIIFTLLMILGLALLMNLIFLQLFGAKIS